MPIWDRQRNEPPVAFECFVVYRDMRAERTIEQAYLKRNGRKCGVNASRHWYAWSTQFNWVDRCRQYDEHLDLVRQLAIEETERLTGNEIARLRTEHKQTEAALASRMFRRALDILNHPMIRKKILEKTEVSEDGKTIHNHITVKMPARFSYNTAALLGVAGSKIGRSGLDIGDDERDIAPEDFSKQFFKSDDELSGALPGGVVPDKPANPAAAPVLKLPANDADVIEGKADRSGPVRPGGNGDGNGHTGGSDGY